MRDWIGLANITLNSGRESKFKIECDYLTQLEVAAMCQLLAAILPPFGAVSGVPTGGLKVEKAMRPYITKGPLLIVDDVWTTGGSVKRHAATLTPDKGYPGHTAVLFARGPTPKGVTALFTIHQGLWYA